MNLSICRVETEVQLLVPGKGRATATEPGPGRKCGAAASDLPQSPS